MREVLCVAVMVICSLVGQGIGQKCKEIAWEKVTGMRPEQEISKKGLYTGMDSQGIISTCFERCKILNCSAFIVDLERSGCFSVETVNGIFVPEPNVTFYHKICLKVPPSCKQDKLWQVERDLGGILFDTTATFFSQSMSRTQCYEKCIEQGDNCKSALFRARRDLMIGDTIGNCSLSMISRGIKPQSYRVSMYRDEYLENQCHNITKTDYCSYAEYRNTSLPYSDVKITGLDTRQCEQRCDESLDGFFCRGYSIDYTSYESPVCLLHSDDTISTGVRSLINAPGFVYKEREPCLDMTVDCSNMSMVVELNTKDPFHGRIYANGFRETCGTQGRGRSRTTLVLPLPKTNDSNSASANCGLSPAFSIDNDNQTRAVIWVTVIVQFNPIIQRLGDQAVRVGCSMNDGNVPGPRNVTVQSSFTFTDPNAGIPTIVWTVMNTSLDAPIIKMSVLDENLQEAVVTHVGQKLILKIEVTPNNGTYDIMAGHLVASSASGDASILLLDEMGCPRNNIDFPALIRDPENNRSLIAKFSAFKFPDSAVVRFNVVVRFCIENCQPVKCEDNVISYGRRKRQVTVSSESGNVTELYQQPKTIAPEEVMAQTVLIVNDKNTSDPMRRKDIPPGDTILIAGSANSEGLFCMNSSLALYLLLFLLIIQIALLFACVIAVRTYRKLAIRAEEDRAEILSRHLYGIHGGNFEISRRVRWADHNGSSIKT